MLNLNIIFIILVFGVIIFIHELGHFLVAKKCGIPVTEFAIGMGPTLYHFTRKETKYCIKLLPIGGYCMMMGEDENSEDPNAFNNKPVWARISVVAAGAVFNFILAFLLSIILITFSGYDSTEIKLVAENSAAYDAGILEGDVITEFDGKNVYNFREVLVYMQFHQSDEPITLSIERNGEEKEITLTPRYVEESGVYQIGISCGQQAAKNVFQVIKYSVLEVRYWIKTTFLSLKALITGQVGMESVSGPVGIASMMNDTLDEANEVGGLSVVLLNVINFCVLISANLGVMNLLPIPALDGGRLLFLIIEAIRRKKIPPEKEAVVHMIGFALLLVFMAFVMFNDIKNVFF